uniref:Ribonuclease H-like domain-containing protein n=1 Tax=Tanacetum cinerariifolium TaxID=118510 RepID=A0A6L2JAY5_TANCI|nr:ribonuclease H-like domain-containing protein [Tanacetum cinerariifolium]
MAGEGSSKTPIASIEALHMVSYVKLPVLKKDEAGNEIELPPVTAQQILARRRETKAKSPLLMAIPDEHLVRFHGIKDAKTLWDAIKTRFSDNVESKKIFQRLLSPLEIHRAGDSTEDANQKFLRSIPSAWSNISLIMTNKPCIYTLDIDDLYNNLKVYEADIKGSFGSSSNSQNVAFVSTESINSTNELNVAYSVSTATGHSSQAQDKEDLEQIDQDDLEEIDLKWQVAMLSMRVKQFYKKTRRNLEFNGKEPVGFDKKNVECFNCHRRGYFARDCKSARNSGYRSRDAGNAIYRGRDNGKRPAKEEDAQALVVQDGLDEALKEKEDLKAKLEKLETSSKNLTKQFDSQISAKVKTGLGYDRQFNEKEVLDIKDKEVTETVLDNRSSDEEISVPNDRFKKGEGYHAVPPPLTRNYMPPKPVLSFAGLDDSIYKFKLSETVTSLAKNKKDAPETSTVFVEKLKEDRSSAPLIEDWKTDSDDDSVYTPKPIPAKTNFMKAG